MQVRGNIAAMFGQPAGQTLYKISPTIDSMNYLTDIPCGKCPVADKCCPGGLISPVTCQYMKDWLAMPDQELF